MIPLNKFLPHVYFHAATINSKAAVAAAACQCVHPKRSLRKRRRAAYENSLFCSFSKSSTQANRPSYNKTEKNNMENMYSSTARLLSHD